MADKPAVHIQISEEEAKEFLDKRRQRFIKKYGQAPKKVLNPYLAAYGSALLLALALIFGAHAIMTTWFDTGIVKKPVPRWIDVQEEHFSAEQLVEWKRFHTLWLDEAYTEALVLWDEHAEAWMETDARGTVAFMGVQCMLLSEDYSRTLNAILAYKTHFWNNTELLYELDWYQAHVYYFLGKHYESYKAFMALAEKEGVYQSLSEAYATELYEMVRQISFWDWLFN